MLYFSRFCSPMLCASMLILQPCFSEHPLSVKDKINEVKAKDGNTKHCDYLEEAFLFEKDQNHPEALKSFIRALDAVDFITDEFPKDPEERSFAQEAYELYVQHIDQNPAYVISELRNRYEPMLNDHPDWHYIKFFKAIADANDHEFLSFYQSFYDAYSNYPQSYLALRTRGVLQLKLYEHLLEDEKEDQRKLALDFFKAGAKKEPRETGAIRLLLFSSTAEERQETINWLLPKILEQDVRLPRKDIALYVRWLINSGNFEEAEKFISQAKTWYDYSRSLKVAEKLLEKAKRKAL